MRNVRLDYRVSKIIYRFVTMLCRPIAGIGVLPKSTPHILCFVCLRVFHRI